MGRPPSRQGVRPQTVRRPLKPVNALMTNRTSAMMSTQRRASTNNPTPPSTRARSRISRAALMTSPLVATAVLYPVG